MEYWLSSKEDGSLGSTEALQKFNRECGSKINNDVTCASLAWSKERSNIGKRILKQVRASDLGVIKKQEDLLNPPVPDSDWIENLKILPKAARGMIVRAMVDFAKADPAINVGFIRATSQKELVSKIRDIGPKTAALAKFIFETSEN